jgi:hypothetical protein
MQANNKPVTTSFATIIPLKLAIITFVVVNFTFIFYHIFANHSAFMILIELIVLTFLTIMIAINYYLAMVTDPGKPSKEPDTIVVLHPEVYCYRCVTPKPKRAHHCTKHDECHLKMDHHCPWILNCVGLYNQKYYYLLLLYTYIGSQFISIELAPQLSSVIAVVWNGMVYRSLFYTVMVGFSGLIAWVICIAVGMMLGLQTYLICVNVTYIEFLRTKKKQLHTAPFYSHNILTNIQEVLGDNVLYWFLPVPAIKREITDDKLVPLL